MQPLKLFMLLLGGKPKGRFTEQHDVFFGIGYQLKDLVPDIKKFWREAAANVHIDAWREVTCIDNYLVTVADKTISYPADITIKKETDLFFINLGGYKEHEFEEFHYKMLMVANGIDAAKYKAKKTAFFRHTSVPDSAVTLGAVAHIDDKYGVDIDDVYAVKDILPQQLKDKYTINLEMNDACTAKEDDYHLGYFKLQSL